MLAPEFSFVFRLNRPCRLMNECRTDSFIGDVETKNLWSDWVCWTAPAARAVGDALVTDSEALVNKQYCVPSTMSRNI